jgi:DNA invertase Pin-like site-specific DNA recombinase
VELVHSSSGPISTLDQTTANQEREPREIAGSMGCEIVKVSH